MPKNPMTTVKLADPVTYDGRQIETLTFRPPVLADAFHLDNPANDLSKAVALVSRFTGEPVAALSRMSINDTIAAIRAFTFHLAKHQSTSAGNYVWPQ